MRMLKLDGGCSVRIVDAPEPHPDPGEVVVQTSVSALCGSELKAYSAEEGRAGNVGHEAAGTVIEVGAGVTLLEVGQRVGLSAVVGCGACAECEAGRYTWCTNLAVHANMHAERIVHPAHGCHPLPDDVSWDAGVLISGDGLGVPYHTSTRLADPSIRTVAVFGVGPIGLGNVLLHGFLGRDVFAVDVSAFRLELAGALGAAARIDVGEADPVAAIRAHTDGRGADACIDAAGKPETLRWSFDAVRPGGVVVMNGEQGMLPLSPSDDFIRRDITAFGSWYYHFGEFERMMALYRQGLRVESLITHRYPLENAATAFEEFAAGRTGKVLLTSLD